MHAATAPSVPAPTPTLIAATVPLPAEPDTSVPALLFGRDERGRAHAACFVGHEPAAVERAADAMDLFLAVADTDDLRDLAAELPVGRLFESGRGFVPFVKAGLYGRLLAATGTPDTPMPVRAAGKAAEAGTKAGGGPG